MKVMLRKKDDGTLWAYVAKKDIEERVVETERAELWGGTITLGNGWTLELPAMPPETRLPVTVEARRLEGEA